MEIMMIAGIILVPLVMVGFATFIHPLRFVFHMLALLSYYSASSVLALAIYHTVSHGTTYTTNVHAILLDPWLLYPGAYLGFYVPYLILMGFMPKNQSP